MNIVNRTLLAPNRFGGIFGIPINPAFPHPKSNPVRQTVPMFPGEAVLIPWNMLIGEGLLGYDLQAEAAQLMQRLMAAVVKNLKAQHAFGRAYNAESGIAIGERNPIQGLAPLSLFLGALGVRIESPQGSRGSGMRPGGSGSKTNLRVVLTGKNPFPWPVTVKYRGLVITRSANQTVIVFPDGQMVTLDDPTDAVVSAA